MRKCPRCREKVETKNRFCPHCGYRFDYAKQKKKPISTLTVFLIFFSLVFIPTAYTRVLSQLMQETTTLQSLTSKELPEQQANEATQVYKTYTTLTEFGTDYTNVQPYIDRLKAFESDLFSQTSLTYSLDQSIIVYNNFNVYFKMIYETVMSSHLSMNVIYEGDRNGDHLVTYQIKQTGMTSFNEVVNDDIITVINEVTQDENQSLFDRMLLREAEFESRKERIGHYGFGVYDGQNSFVIYRDGELYKTVFNYVMKGQ